MPNASKPAAEPAEREFLVTNLDRKQTVAQRVRLAGTSATRRKGLLEVDALAAGTGLWITPCEAIHTFGMRMPIDAIFIDRTYRVRKLRTNLAPGRIALCLTAESVLEVAAGTVERTAMATGDRLRFEEIPATDVAG